VFGYIASNLSGCSGTFLNPTFALDDEPFLYVNWCTFFLSRTYHLLKQGEKAKRKNTMGFSK